MDCCSSLGGCSVLCSEGSEWEFHFHDVTVLGTVLYGYTWLVPITLWAGLWWRNHSDQYTLTQLLAVYGYCMAIFIPVVVRPLYMWQAMESLWLPFLQGGVGIGQ